MPARAKSIISAPYARIQLIFVFTYLAEPIRKNDGSVFRNVNAKLFFRTPLSLDFFEKINEIWAKFMDFGAKGKYWY